MGWLTEELWFDIQQGQEGFLFCMSGLAVWPTQLCPGDWGLLLCVGYVKLTFVQC